jgi:hypothetical protein
MKLWSLSKAPIFSLSITRITKKLHRSSTMPSKMCSASTLPTQFRANLYRDSNCLQSHVFVRWTGWILAPSTGSVTFSLTVGSNSPISETVKLYLDSHLYIDTMSCFEFSNIGSLCHPQIFNTAVINFNSISYYAIEVQLLSYSQIPFIRMDWSHSGGSSTLIPSSNLFSQRGTVTPSALPVLNAVVSATKSSQSGSGLSLATCGYIQSFSITLRDALSNIMKNSYSESINIFCRIESIPGSCTNCPAVIPCKATLDRESGLGSASYIVTKSGQYQAKVSIAPAIAPSYPFIITSSPWSGFLSINSTGSYFFSTSVSNANSVSITISGQTVAANTSAVTLNASISRAIPFEIGFTGTSSLILFWKVPTTATFTPITSSSIYGPRIDLSSTSTISASSSNAPSPLFATVSSLSTFTAGLVSSATISIKDEFANAISLNFYNDTIAFMSNFNPSTAASEFVSYPASLSGSTHTFAIVFTKSGLYKITAKVVESYRLQWKLFGNSYCSGAPALSGVETSLNYDWGSSFIALNNMPFSPFINVDGSSVEWTGYFLSRNSGAQTYMDCSGVGGIKIMVNGLTIVDQFEPPNSNSSNQPFSVRAHMRTLSSWNFIKIQYRDSLGIASIVCSGFGSMGSSYFLPGSGTVSVTSTGLTFSQSQNLISGTSIYIFAQHSESWRTSILNGYAQAMPIYRGTLSSDCMNASCTAAPAANTPITSQRFFYLLPTSTVTQQDIERATSYVYGSLTSIPGFDEFAVMVLPTFPCASTSRSTIPSISILTSGATSKHDIRCVDAFSNLCSSCGTSFLVSQSRPYFTWASISGGSLGSLSSLTVLTVPAPNDMPITYAVSTFALVEGFLACTYYSSSLFLNNPLVSGFQIPAVASTTNPATGLPATFYGTYFVRWEGYLKATSTASYSIKAQSNLAGNEKLRMWINDATIIDNWTMIVSEMNGTFSATSGVSYLIKIEFEASHSIPSKMMLEFATGSHFTTIPSENLQAAVHVKGSPFFIKVNPVFGNVVSTLSGTGLSVATVGHISRFRITLKDSILNSTFVNANLTSALFWTALNNRPWHDFSVNISQTATGLYTATYNVTRSGTFSLEITCTSLQSTSTSVAGAVCNSGLSIPLFSVNVFPAYAGRASIVTCASNVTVGLLQTLTISAKDSFGNSLSGDGNSFFRVTLANGPEIHSVPQVHISVNNYEVKYRVSTSGTYGLLVQALIPGLSKQLISDSLAISFSSIVTTVSSAVLDFSDSATFQSTSSSELLYLMRYSGFIRPITSGLHTFWINNPDTTKRHRTWLSDRYIIDSWQATSAATEYSAVIGMASNSFYEVFIDFANSGQSSSTTKSLSLQWQYSGVTKSDIPSSRLFQFYQNVSAFTISAFPRSVCASACILSGIGLSLATSGEASSFTIQMRDEFSNPTTVDRPTFVAQIVGDATIRHPSKRQRNIHGIFQSVTGNVISGAYVPIWKKGPPASYYNSLFQEFQNFNPYSGTKNDTAYWPMAYGGLFATAYAGPFEQLIISAAVPNGIHATYYNRLNDNGTIVRSNSASSQVIVPGIPSAPVFNAGRFQGFFQPTFQGLYTFNIAKPNSQSSRFWIDGVLLIDDWASPSQTSVSGTIFLSLSPNSPMFSFTLEYDHSISPSISLQYACNQSSFASIPAASFFLRFDIPARVQGTSGSLSATYYDSNTCDPKRAIASAFVGSDFSFSSSSSNSVPVPGAWTDPGTFSVRWKGFISPPRSDLFTFFLTKGHSSEYATLFLDDAIAISLSSTELEKSASYLFNHVPKPESFYSIAVEYGSSSSAVTKKLEVSWFNSGLSMLPFLFSPPSFTQQFSNSFIIPKSRISDAYLSTVTTSFTSDSSYVSTIYPFDNFIGCASSPGISAFACSTIQLRIGATLNIVVQAGRLCASKSLSFGSCLTLMTSGKTCEFYVVAKDSFGNHRVTEMDAVAAVSKSALASIKFPSISAARQVQGLHATYYNEEYGNSGSAVETVILCCNVAVSKAHSSILSNLQNDFFFSARFRGFLSLQHSSQRTFPYTVNVAISTSSAGDQFTILINNQVQTMPTIVVVESAVFKPVLLEAIYMHNSGVSRDIDWRLVFTYANGSAAQFSFMPSPIISNFGDTSALYSVYAEATHALATTLSVALGETETSSFRVCYFINATALFPCNAIYLQDIFSGGSSAFMLPDTLKFFNVSVDAVVSGYVLPPCTCPLIITFESPNLILLYWDGTKKLSASNQPPQYRTTSVKVDGKFGMAHFLRAVFTKSIIPGDFGMIKVNVVVDPLFRASFSSNVKFVPFFNVLATNPASFRVSPGELCSATSMFWGGGLSFAFMNGVSNSVFVQCRDHWSNNRTVADAGIFMYKLQLITPVSHLASLRYTTFSDAGFGVITSSYTYAYISHSQPTFRLEFYLSQNVRRGLLATYYSDNQLQIPFRFIADDYFNEAVTRAFPLLGNDPSKLFSARWTGLIFPQFTGELTFTLTTGANSYVTMFIDGYSMFNFRNNAVVSTTVTATMESTGIANSYYEIYLEYFHFNMLSSSWTVNLGINGVLIPKNRFIAVQKVIASAEVLPIWPIHPIATNTSSVIGSGFSIMTAGVSSHLTLTVKDPSGAAYPSSFWNASVLVARLVPADDSIAPWPREGDLGWATFTTTNSTFKTGIRCYQCPSQVIGSVTSNGSPSGFIVSFLPSISGSYYMSLSIAVIGSLHSTFYGAASSQRISSITNMLATRTGSGKFQSSSRVYNMHSLGLRSKQEYFGHYIGTLDSSIQDKFAFGVSPATGLAGLSEVSSSTYRSLHRIPLQVSSSSIGIIDFSRASGPPVTGLTVDFT